MKGAIDQALAKLKATSDESLAKLKVTLDASQNANHIHLTDQLCD
jgi:hypothetical protein